MKKKMHDSTFGSWDVAQFCALGYGSQGKRAEGDVEGRTTRHLGTFIGHVDEIALYLADKQYYGLRFRLVDRPLKYKPTKKEVHVSFDIDTGTWENVKLVEEMEQFFANRPVKIEKSNHFACFKIVEDKEKILPGQLEDDLFEI